MKIKCYASLCRGRRSGPGMPGKDVVTLTVEDQDAGIQFMEIEMDMEIAAGLMTGASVTVEAELRGLDSVGMMSENKRVNVPSIDFLGLSREERQVKAEEVLKPFEVDGWTGRSSDLMNGHRRNEDGTYSVVFHRHVPKVVESE